MGSEQIYLPDDLAIQLEELLSQRKLAEALTLIEENKAMLGDQYETVKAWINSLPTSEGTEESNEKEIPYGGNVEQNQDGPGMKRGQGGPGMKRGQGGPGMMQDQGGPGMMQGQGGPGMMQGQGGPGMKRGQGGPGMKRGQGGPGMKRGQGGPGMMQGQGGPGMMQGQGGPGMMQGQGGPASINQSQDQEELSNRGAADFPPKMDRSPETYSRKEMPKDTYYSDESQVEESQGEEEV